MDSGAWLGCVFSVDIPKRIAQGYYTVRFRGVRGWRDAELAGRETELAGRETELAGRETELAGRETELAGRMPV